MILRGRHQLGDHQLVDAVVGVGVSLTLANDVCTAARVAVGAVAPTVRLVDAAADALKESEGAIVNTASVAGVGKQGSSLVYSATKTGLVSLTRSLARGLAPKVRVNAVAPGQVKTPWTENWSEERKQFARDQSVLNRRSSPEEIAQGMLYLCAGTTMVTGHVLVIDGGQTL